MIEVDKNSYVDLIFAANYIDDSYRLFDDLACRFRVLSDTEKESYLINSCRQINKLVMQGKPVNRGQPLAFPRMLCFREYEVPIEVKQAQVENALGLLKEEFTRRSTEQINMMSSLGAMQNIKYNKREQGDVGLGMVTAVKIKRLASKRAEELLNPWIGGNV
jgi:hypothetical protein